MKTLKFRHHLVAEILSGRKTVTWRLFDDKDLRVGDQLELVDWETKEKFAITEITHIRLKRLGEIVEEDFRGHEKFSSPAEMFRHYREYYGDRVSEESLLKIIVFKIVSPCG